MSYAKSLPTNTRHKPKPQSKPMIRAVNFDKWAGHEPFEERNAILAQQARDREAIEAFIRANGVTRLAPSGSGAKTGKVITHA